MNSNSLHDFFDKFTDNAKMSLNHAEGIARSLGTNYIGTEHILLGVLAQRSSIASKILKTSGVDIEKARLALNMASRPVVVMGGGSKKLSENAKLALKMSWDIAQEFNQDYCGTEHILYSIITQKNARATMLLRDMSTDTDKIVDELEQYLNRQQYDLLNQQTAKPKRKQKSGALDYFGTDVTALARSGKLDPLIGREKELDRMVTILSRRHKNNPMLIGEPGVGKTAIIDGLSQKIVEEDVPDNLIDKRVIMLDLSAMIAGTKYRGEFEERIKRVVKELKQDKSVIVFIDEIHLLVGAGAAEGAVDAANMLKPMLARGELKLIGATTLDEYSKHIEKDAALERRFQTIIVKEPTKQETLAILRGIKKHYEDFHGVVIEDEVLRDTVRLSTRYVNNRFMPDKAIDLLDDASASVRINKAKSSPQFRKLNKELRIIKERMEDAVDEENYERAAYYKTRIIQIDNKLKELRENVSKKNRLQVTSDDIASAVSIATGIPMKKVQKQEAKYLLNLEKHLKKFVVGQDEAISHIAKSIRRNRSGVGDTKRPIGSFIFLGPTGVGKTELARVLARELYDNEEALIKVDMSEFADRHTASKLIGAPAGFVGYDDSNGLADKIRRNPYSLVLFDEMEKAHADIFNIFLQILEDGYITDSKSRKVDFTNTVVIMTSNIGADLLQKEASLGFSVNTEEDRENLNDLHDKNSKAILGRLKKTLRPELLNRFDKAIVFKSLDKKTARKILKLQIAELYDRLADQGIGLNVTNAASNHLLEKGYDKLNGVRPLRRIIEQEIGDKIADNILSGSIEKGDVVKIDMKKGKIVAGKVEE